jgi:zinc/manganese transport system permease protein
MIHQLAQADPGAWGQPFFQHALLAGLPIGALSGLVGYLMVLRREMFTADALSHAAFTGALGALAFGVDARVGLFVVTTGVALLLAGLSDRRTADDVLTGTVFAWVMGLGVLALSLYTGNAQGAKNGGGGVGALFGSIFGLSAAQAALAASIAGGLLLVLGVLLRPLLFASVDPLVARSRAVPVRVLGLVFLLVVAATAAEATQAVGALLLLGLLAGPGGAAARLAANPFVGAALAPALGAGTVLAGLALGNLVPTMPPSVAIILVAGGLFVGSGVVRAR